MLGVEFGGLEQQLQLLVSPSHSEGMGENRNLEVPVGTPVVR